MLGALAIGCAAGWSLCHATACSTASAGGSEGSIVSAPCNVQGTANGKPATFAVLALPGRAKEDLAVNVVRLQGSPVSSADTTIPGGTFYNASDLVSSELPLVSDGAVAVECVSGTGTVSFFVR